MKKIKVLSALIAICGTFILLQSSAPPPPGMVFDVDPSVETLEQTPPKLKHIWVKKLVNDPNGTMLARIELDTSYCYDTLSDTVNIWWGDGVSNRVTFYDNATNGDNIAADGIFSAYFNENVSAFRAEVLATEAALIAQGGYIKFTGHSGEKITSVPHFDVITFDAGTEVELHTDFGGGMLTLTACESIVREKSLFITDLSVVEDDGRTYNFVAPTSGNPIGAWTFGEMFKNMAGTSGSAKALLKSWVKHWTVNFTLNGQLVERREDVIPLLIAPWIEKASGGVLLASGITISNWESEWDKAVVTDYNLRIYAPFKLTAIVNRLDLRGNASYHKDIQNAGETRFIFTLIGYDGNTPKALDPNLPSGTLPGFNGFMDWEGLNVIFEYENVQASRCEIKALAQKWYGLSEMGLGSPEFKAELQEITDYVTSVNSMPSKVNGSAISRIRTNERIFYQPEDPTLLAFEDHRWGHADWEFRQFELNATTNLFEQVPLNNTPINFANVPTNLTDAKYYIKRSNHYSGSIENRFLDADYPYGTGSYSMFNNLHDWCVNPFIIKNIERGNHNMATTFHGKPLLGASTIVVGEFSHYWNAVNFNSASSLGAAYPEARHQLSLNTCEGCHNGETKTIFTHIQPLAVTEAARYWLPPALPPDHQEGYVDCPGNGHNSDGINADAALYPSLAGKRYFQHVSAFLTGTNYSGPVGFPVYDDDDITDADDDNMNGLFYVNNPAHYGSGTITKYGYNDLLRRRNDLCWLINSSCTSPSLLNMVKNASNVPLPLSAH